MAACSLPDPRVVRPRLPCSLLMVSKPHHRHGAAAPSCLAVRPCRWIWVLRRPDLAAGSPNGRASKEKGVGCGKPDSYRCRLGRGARRKAGEAPWLQDQGRQRRPTATPLGYGQQICIGLGLNKPGLVGCKGVDSATQTPIPELAGVRCASDGHHSWLRATVGFHRRYAC